MMKHEDNEKKYLEIYNYIMDLLEKKIELYAKRNCIFATVLLILSLMIVFLDRYRGIILPVHVLVIFLLGICLGKMRAFYKIREKTENFYWKRIG